MKLNIGHIGRSLNTYRREDKRPDKLLLLGFPEKLNSFSVTVLNQIVVLNW